MHRKYKPDKGNAENGNRQEDTNEGKRYNETGPQETNMYLEKKVEIHADRGTCYNKGNYS